MDTSWYATDLQLPHRHLLPGEYYLPTSDMLVQVETQATGAEEKEYSMDELINNIITLTIND